MKIKTLVVFVFLLAGVIFTPVILSSDNGSELSEDISSFKIDNVYDMCYFFQAHKYPQIDFKDGVFLDGSS